LLISFITLLISVLNLQIIFEATTQILLLFLAQSFRNLSISLISHYENPEPHDNFHDIAKSMIKNILIILLLKDSQKTLTPFFRFYFWSMFLSFLICTKATKIIDEDL
jgi:hypothetical protein